MTADPPIAANDGLLVHMEHLLSRIQQLSGESFLSQTLISAKLPNPWSREAARDLTLHHEASLIQTAAHLSGDPSYATRLGLSYSTVTSVPGYVARNSRTLRSAIQRSKRYTAISSGALDYDLRESEGRAALWVRTQDPAIDRSIAHREFGVFAVLSILRYLSNRPFRPQQVTFRHRRTAGAPAVAKAAGCPVIWEAPEDSLRMSAEILDLPIPTYDPRLRDLLMQHGETLLAAPKRSGATVQERVEFLILDGFADGAPSADDIAAKLGMSRRTLTRRLSEGGLTFRQVLDRVRMDIARSYLRDTSLSVAEVAFQLGYADQAAFTTAYKRWTGQTPSAARARVTAS